MFYNIATKYVINCWYIIVCVCYRCSSKWTKNWRMPLREISTTYNLIYSTWRSCPCSDLSDTDLMQYYYICCRCASARPYVKQHTKYCTQCCYIIVSWRIEDFRIPDMLVRIQDDENMRRVIDPPEEQFQTREDPTSAAWLEHRRRKTIWGFKIMSPEQLTWKKRGTGVGKRQLATMEGKTALHAAPWDSFAGLIWIVKYAVSHIMP